MTTLLKANSQWERRSADERFSSIEAMHKQATRQREQAAVVSLLRACDLEVTAQDGQVRLLGRSGQQASLTNWSFGQIAQKARAPASYLRTLPAELAADCLQSGLKRPREEDDNSRGLRLLFNRDEDLTLRAVTSDQYARIWNSDVTSRLVELKQAGPWQEAPAAFDDSRGQYLSDRDMFSFFVDNNRRIFEKGPGGGLSRGFFAWNSEVGASSFGVMTFMYEYVCGNHRVWGAENVREVRVRHVGEASDRGFDELQLALMEYAEGSTKEDELKIKRAMRFQIGATKDEVLDAIFGLNVLSRKTIGAAYDLAVKREEWYGNPRSAWGMAGGVTEIARDLANADERVAMDRAATKVMELAW
jgi:hypothetical protein